MNIENGGQLAAEPPASRGAVLPSLQAAGRPSPPKPPFSLTIGIVGHRPDRLPQDKELFDKVEQRVAHVLAQIRHQSRDVCDEYSEYFAVELQASLELSL